MNKLIELSDIQTKDSIKNDYKLKLSLQIINLVNNRKLLILENKNKRLAAIKKMEEEQKILVDSINNKILALKILEQGELLYSLSELKDSYNISKSLGISESSFSTFSLLDSSRLVLSFPPEPYQYGEKVLKAKIDILNEKIKRETPNSKLLILKQELFLAKNNSNLNSLKSNQNYTIDTNEIIAIDFELKRLELIDLNWDNFISMEIHQNALTKQVKQLSKTITLVVIIFLGFLLSIVLAFMMEKILKNRATN